MRIMSGIQPTGSLHIGNYLGAIKNWIRLQADYEAFFSIVDLHALTIRPDADTLRAAVREIAIGVIASGVSADRSVLFVQSRVPGHADLAWVFSCFTQLGDLNRMTQFKDKAKHQPDNVNAGLFTYPVLQTADIALYRAEGVPVGEDQVQHLELAREIIRRFNATYGDTFPEPKPLLSPAPRVMGVDGETKMSKSRGNDIGMFDTPDQVWEKLRGAKTDPARLRRSDRGNPSVCNVYSYHGFFTDDATRATVDRDCRTAAIGCIDCKKILAGGLERELGPVRERADALRRSPREIDDVLGAGAARARREAEQTMEMVRARTGMEVA
jgi:tryptophanyl-tRNA synthetase